VQAGYLLKVSMTWPSNFFESYALGKQSRGSFDALLINQEEAAKSWF